MSNIFIGLKKTCLGVLDTEERDKDYDRGLEEGAIMKMSTTVLPLRDARSLRLNTYAHCATATTSIKDNECLINVSI